MNKNGNLIILMYFYVVFILIVFFIFIYFFQLNNQIFRIKKDLFYIVQNSFLALNQEEIIFNNFKINDKLLNEKILKLLNLNFPNYDLKIEKIKYYNKSIDIIINYKFIPLSTIFKLPSKNISIREVVKLKEISYD